MPKSQPHSEATLVVHLRPSRRKAQAAALAELLAVLRDLGAVRSLGGPLSAVRGVTWVRLPEENVVVASSRLHRLGYTSAIDLVRPLTQNVAGGAKVTTRWKGRDVALVRVYEEPDAQLRDSAPDRRTFLLEGGDGIVRPVAGYRGGRGSLEHRALPVVDARLLVNLVSQPTRGVLLDPFAGAGGVVIEAKLAGWLTVSLDNDRILRFGLNQLADYHIVGSATMLPLADASVDAIASEPPYHPPALEVVIDSIAEMARVLRPRGRVALLVASDQTQPIRRAAHRANLTIELDAPIERKGTSVSCLCCTR